MFDELYGALLDGRPGWTDVTIATVLALVFACAVAEIVARVARSGFLALAGADDTPSVTDPVVRRPIRIIRGAVFLLAAVTLLLPALQLIGVSVQAAVGIESVGVWMLRSGLRTVLIAVSAYAFIRAAAMIVRRFERQMTGEGGVDAQELGRRVQTLGSVIRNAIGSVVIGVAALMILRELNIDILPILTGAGIVGLAVGFGAQSLVRDIISGFFLLLENHVRVGDVAVINGTGGLVETIRLRTIVLRDLSGTVHVFPNGGIDTLANMTKDYSYYVINVGVAYKEDTDAVIEVLRRVGAELESDPQYRASIMAPLEVLGVDAFEDSQVTIKIRIKTVPLKQWSVGRELRRRIKKAFDATGIEIPFPHQSVYFGEASRPWLVEQIAGDRRNA